MIYLFMHAKLKDFDKWKTILTDFMPTLEEMGATDTSIYRDVDNTSDITVIHKFPSKEKAEAFVNSPALHKSRKKAEVVGTPEI
ncbi:DUF1330 domain-containing protein [Microbulbifer echini]|uniref:DUF1330 domain-containing protein n=1 Tax=Microbulbifer echini TaxID=1529067 RepID=A0ABV4NR53_9GAMM